MCEYCENGKRIETEVDNEGCMLVYDADPEYHADGWTVDVYANDGQEPPLWMYSFNVPCCPMCGRRLED